MYNKRKKHCAVIWLKGYYYSNDRNKSILSVAWCQWKGIITFSEENILVSKHTSTVFITFYSTCVSKGIGKEMQLVCDAGEKIFGFICSTKISESIILSSNSPSHHSILFCHPLCISYTYLNVILLQRVKIKIQILKESVTESFRC